MYSKEVTVTNQVGLHAHPAINFVQMANEFKEEIKVTKDERVMNAKSLLGVLSLGVTKGSTIVISASGENEVEVVEALVAFVEANFERKEG